MKLTNEEKVVRMVMDSVIRARGMWAVKVRCTWFSAIAGIALFAAGGEGVAQLPGGAKAPPEPLPGSIPDQQSGRLNKQYKIREGEFTVSSRLAGNPTIKVRYHAPETPDGRLAATAADLVFYAPYIRELDPLGSKDNQYLRDLTEVHGMTVFSMLIKSEWADLDAPDRLYYFERSGSYDTVGRAWEQVRSKLSLPYRNLLIVGNSGGGTMAVGLALKYPDKIDALAFCGASHFNTLLEGKSAKLQVPTYAVITRSDVRYRDNLEFLQGGHAEGAPFLFSVWPSAPTELKGFSAKSGINFHHWGHKRAFRSLDDFVVSVRDARARGAVKPERWVENVPMRFWEPGEEPSLASLKELEAAPAKVPDAMFKASYDSNLYRFARVPMPDGEELPVVVRYPEVPRGVILFGGRSTDGTTEVGDALDVLGVEGWIAVGVLSEKGQNLPDGYWESIIAWIAEQPNWHRYPLHLVGWEDSARDFLLLAAANPALPITSISALEGSLLYPEAGKSPAEAVTAKMPTLLLAGKKMDFAEREPVVSFLNATHRVGLPVGLVGVEDRVIGDLDPETRLLAAVAAALPNLRPRAGVHPRVNGR